MFIAEPCGCIALMDHSTTNVLVVPKLEDVVSIWTELILIFTTPIYNPDYFIGFICFCVIYWYKNIWKHCKKIKIKNNSNGRTNIFFFFFHHGKSITTKHARWHATNFVERLSKAIWQVFGWTICLPPPVEPVGKFISLCQSQLVGFSEKTPFQPLTFVCPSLFFYFIE